MTGATVVRGRPQGPDPDVLVIHQAAGAVRAMSGVAINDALAWLDDAAQSVDVTAADVARSFIRVIERHHAELRPG